MTVSDLVIRPAVCDDAEAIAAIYAPYVTQTAVSFEYVAPTADEIRRRMEKTLKRYPYFVATVDNRLIGCEPHGWQEKGFASEKAGFGVTHVQSGTDIVGYAYAGPFHPRAAFFRSAETSIYVERGFHQRGIGRALYERLESALKQQGILNLNACIAYPDPEDEYLTLDSVRFHERLGYVIVAHFHKCGWKFNRWYDMVWMEKMIGEHE
ncbi:MAG: N-acetyltransferase [Thermoguttaceae bacterium]|nr:N-acetyltransferase [Thermoguttaceae bacterium]